MTKVTDICRSTKKKPRIALPSSVLFITFLVFRSTGGSKNTKTNTQEGSGKTQKPKKNGGKKTPRFFVMSPGDLFCKKTFRVFELPLLRNAQKRDKKTNKQI
jgi:hypothetical protein